MRVKFLLITLGTILAACTPLPTATPVPSIPPIVTPTSGEAQDILTATGDDRRAVRSEASDDLRAVIAALAHCRQDGGYNFNGDGGAQMRLWLEEAAWREVAIFPARRNVAYWANYLELHNCWGLDINDFRGESLEGL